MRFTDIDKWTDPWFDSLSQVHKLIHLYLCDRCDCAGVWKVNLRDLEFRTAATPSDWSDFIEQAGDERLHFLDDKFTEVWLIKFIPFQHPTGFNIKNNAVKGIAKRLAGTEAPLERLPSPYQAPLRSLISGLHGINNLEGAYNPLARGLQGAQDKDKDPEQVMEKAKAERKGNHWR